MAAARVLLLRRSMFAGCRRQSCGTCFKPQAIREGLDWHHQSGCAGLQLQTFCDALARLGRMFTWKAAMASLSDFSCEYSVTSDLQRVSASFWPGDGAAAAGDASPADGCGGVGGRPEPGAAGGAPGAEASDPPVPLRGLSSSGFRCLQAPNDASRTRYSGEYDSLSHQCSVRQLRHKSTMTCQVHNHGPQGHE